MPNSLINSYNKKYGISKKKLEKRWKKAEAIAKKNNQEKNYAYITGVFKKMNSITESLKELNEETLKGKKVEFKKKKYKNKDVLTFTDKDGNKYAYIKSFGDKEKLEKLDGSSAKIDIKPFKNSVDINGEKYKVAFFKL